MKKSPLFARKTNITKRWDTLEFGLFLQLVIRHGEKFIQTKFLLKKKILRKWFPPPDCKTLHLLLGEGIWHSGYPEILVPRISAMSGFWFAPYRSNRCFLTLQGLVRASEISVSDARQFNCRECHKRSGYVERMAWNRLIKKTRVVISEWCKIHRYKDRRSCHCEWIAKWSDKARNLDWKSQSVSWWEKIQRTQEYPHQTLFNTTRRYC